MYSIYLTKTVDDKKHILRIKTYPFKIQCVIWLYLQGWVFSGLDDWHSQPMHFVMCPSCPGAKVEIVKEGNLG